jgi:carboxyl-terminal processing protease
VADQSSPAQADHGQTGESPETPERSGTKQSGHSTSRAHHYVRLTAFMLMVLIVGVTAGMLVERYLVADRATSTPQFPDLGAVTSILENDFYYRPSDPVAEATWTAGLEQQAIGGMLGGLDDKYTRYLEPQAATSASNQLSGTYGGIGVSIGTPKDQVTITTVLPAGPAAKAGILPGDIILAVDGRDVTIQSDISALIQGQIGTKVNLTLQRLGETTPRMFDITREEIVTAPVTYTMIPGTRYAVIRIEIFGDQTTALVNTYLKQAESDHAAGIILDLRGNGGGWVNSAQEVIGRFVPSTSGPALYEDPTSAAGGEVSLPILNGDEAVYTGPLVVLVDAGTASAAEIVAGALRDYDRAAIVGRKTFGKGSVQRIYDFKDGSSMRVTVAEWLTPTKRPIQAVGISPDVTVSQDEHASSDRDSDLVQAILVLDAGASQPSALVSSGSPEVSPIASPSIP